MSAKRWKEASWIYCIELQTELEMEMAGCRENAFTGLVFPPGTVLTFLWWPSTLTSVCQNLISSSTGPASGWREFRAGNQKSTVTFEMSKQASKVEHHAMKRSLLSVLISNSARNLRNVWHVWHPHNHRRQTRMHTFPLSVSHHHGLHNKEITYYYYYYYCCYYYYYYYYIPVVVLVRRAAAQPLHQQVASYVALPSSVHTYCAGL